MMASGVLGAAILAVWFALVLCTAIRADVRRGDPDAAALFRRLARLARVARSDRRRSGTDRIGYQTLAIGWLMTLC